MQHWRENLRRCINLKPIVTIKETWLKGKQTSTEAAVGLYPTVTTVLISYCFALKKTTIVNSTQYSKLDHQWAYEKQCYLKIWRKTQRTPKENQMEKKITSTKKTEIHIVHSVIFIFTEWYGFIPSVIFYADDKQ